MAKKEDKTGGHDTITVTEDQLSQARTAVNMQAEAHGLDMDDPKIQAFLEHVAKNKAASMAWDLFNCNIINKVTMQGHWAPGGCKHVHKHEEES